MFEWHDQKLVIFPFRAFRAVFVGYCTLFWGSVDIYKEYDSPYILERNDKILIVYVFIVVLVNYCPQFWGCGVIYKVNDT
jgi:hypothetical protein